MPGTSGKGTKDALLRALGEHEIQIDELVKMPVKKGIMTGQEWDDAMNARFVNHKWPSSFWVCQDSLDRSALDQFFG